MIDTQPQESLTNLLQEIRRQAGTGGGSEGLRLPCRRADPELFFAERPADVEYAKSLCQSCPVREACLAGARERREPWGVWGGELFDGGAIVAQKRSRGRPRKHPVPAAA